MFGNIIVKYKEIMLLLIGTILIILAIFLLLYDQVSLIKQEVFDTISLQKYNENQANDDHNTPDNNDNSSNNDQSIDITTNYLDDNNNIDDKEDDPNDNPSVQEPITKPAKEYIGYLEIKKISLKTGLVAKESYYNNVNRNVQILSVSDYPDVLNGNLILASHSGNSKISYFKNLYKLSLGDETLIYYKDYVYHYKIVDIYNVPKTGSVEIKRNRDKTVLTLITCTKNSSTEQTVYIQELFSKTRNGGNND